MPRKAHPTLARLSQEEQRKLIEIAAMRRKERLSRPIPSFFDYLEGVRLRDVGADSASITLDWTPWPHLLERAHSWTSGNSEVILKARQLGLSWLAASYVAWRTLFPGFRSLLISQGEEYAKELLNKVKFVNEHHLAFKQAYAEENQSYLKYSSSGGDVLALPSTENAGSGFTGGLVVVDEAAKHPYAEKNFAAYRPTVADGGQLIILSSSQGPQGFFFRAYQDAAAGISGFTPVFIPITARPDRDQSWYNAEEARWSDKTMFKQEYPLTPEEAWVASEGLVIPNFSAANVSSPQVPFDQCVAKVAGIDPGGDDPTVIGIHGAYRPPNAQSGALRYHSYDHLYSRKMVSVDEMVSYLFQWRGLQAVFVDAPPKSPLIAQLRAYGVPAYAASKERGPGLMLMNRLVKDVHWTISPHMTDGIAEFSSYWWHPKSSAKFATITGEGHHADFIDEARYALVGMEQMVRGALGSQMPAKPTYRKRR